MGARGIGRDVLGGEGWWLSGWAAEVELDVDAS